jgi:hypothetical protein
LRAVNGNAQNPINKDWELTNTVQLTGKLSLYYRNDRPEGTKPANDTNWYTGGFTSIGQQPRIDLITETAWVSLGETTARPVVNRLDADVSIDANTLPAVFSTRLRQ